MAVEGGLCIWNLPALLFPCPGVFVLAAFTWAFYNRFSFLCFYPPGLPTPSSWPPRAQHTERHLFSRSHRSPLCVAAHPCLSPQLPVPLRAAESRPGPSGRGRARDRGARKGGTGRPELAGAGRVGSTRGWHEATLHGDLLEKIRGRMERVKSPDQVVRRR